MNRDRYIYFFKPVGLKGPIKIGWSSTPRVRLENLSTWSPFELELIGTFPGTDLDERYLHESLCASHRHHEWFDATDLVAKVIEQSLSDGGLHNVREWLKPVGPIRKWGNRSRTPEMSLYRKYLAKIRAIERRVKQRVPGKVYEILDSWRYGVCQSGTGWTPSETDFEAMHDYIALYDHAAKKPFEYVRASHIIPPNPVIPGSSEAAA